MLENNVKKRVRNPVGAVLRNKDFCRVWASNGLDNTCRWMEVVVMGWLVLEMTDSPFQVAMLFALRWTPMLFFSIFSGAIADRVNRWLVVAVARSGNVLVTAVVLFLVISDSIQPWHLLVASLALGWMYVLEFPSLRSMIYDIVGGPNIVSAMSLETLSITVGRFIGPLAAGLWIEFSGFTGAYVFLLAGYGVSLGIFQLIKTRTPVHATPSRSLWQNLTEGLRYALANRVIRGVLGVTLIMNAMAFSAESLFPVVARDHLHVGAGLAGVLISAQSIGTLAAAAVIANLGTIRYHGRIFCVGTTLQFLSLLLFALSPWYGLSVVMLLLVGLGIAGFSTMQNTIILISATPEMRGRALGVLGQCIGVAALGGLAVGGIANYYDARIAVAISAIIGLVLLAPVIALSPLVRHPIMPPDTVDEARSGNIVNQAAQTPD